jgi:hypothetical protein
MSKENKPFRWGKGGRPAAVRDAHRAIIADLYLKCYPINQIVTHIIEETGHKLTRATVAKDLQALRKKWQEEASLSTQQFLERELQRIDRLELEAWKEWDVRKDPRLLNTISNCIDKRIDLLDLKSPRKVDVTHRGSPLSFTLVLGDRTPSDVERPVSLDFEKKPQLESENAGALPPPAKALPQTIDVKPEPKDDEDDGQPW